MPNEAIIFFTILAIYVIAFAIAFVVWYKSNVIDAVNEEIKAGESFNAQAVANNASVSTGQRNKVADRSFNTSEGAESEEELK